MRRPDPQHPVVHNATLNVVRVGRRHPVDSRQTHPAALHNCVSGLLQPLFTTSVLPEHGGAEHPKLRPKGVTAPVVVFEPRADHGCPYHNQGNQNRSGNPPYKRTEGAVGNTSSGGGGGLASVHPWSHRSAVLYAFATPILPHGNPATRPLDSKSLHTPIRSRGAARCSSRPAEGF